MKKYFCNYYFLKNTLKSGIICPQNHLYGYVFQPKKDTLKNTYVVFYSQKLTHRIIGQNLNGQNLPRAPSLCLCLCLSLFLSVCVSFSLARDLANCMSGALVTESARARGFGRRFLCCCIASWEKECRAF